MMNFNNNMNNNNGDHGGGFVPIAKRDMSVLIGGDRPLGKEPAKGESMRVLYDRLYAEESHKVSASASRRMHKYCINAWEFCVSKKALERAAAPQSRSSTNTNKKTSPVAGFGAGSVSLSASTSASSSSTSRRSASSSYLFGQDRDRDTQQGASAEEGQDSTLLPGGPLLSALNTSYRPIRGGGGSSSSTTTASPIGGMIQHPQPRASQSGPYTRDHATFFQESEAALSTRTTSAAQMSSIVPQAGTKTILSTSSTSSSSSTARMAPGAGRADLAFLAQSYRLDTSIKEIILSFCNTTAPLVTFFDARMAGCATAALRLPHQTKQLEHILSKVKEAAEGGHQSIELKPDAWAKEACRGTGWCYPFPNAEMQSLGFDVEELNKDVDRALKNTKEKSDWKTKTWIVRWSPAPVDVLCRK
ncbi:unnamed protein product [Amoebophrya sp. A25]|nr:unnamed protein product [Amoebophrya sp. A25]|eukprot:GSA25T00013909001.1